MKIFKSKISLLYMKILVSFFTDRFSILKDFWERAAENSSGGAFQGTDKYEKLKLGGFLMLLDWNNKKILKKIKIETPRGFDLLNDKLYITKSNQETFVMSKDLKRRLYKFSNPYFNNLHWVSCYGNKLLFACSGLDMILETNNKGKTTYKWFATEHGFNKDPKGRIRRVEIKKDYRTYKFPTLRQTTHLNSVIYAKKTKYFKKTIYASLFHQGKVIAINKFNGKYKTVLNGLKHPHSIRKVKEGYVISDTENGRIVIVDENFLIKHYYILKGSNWIQDCSLMSNGNFIVCDSNNNRIIELDSQSGKIKDSYKYNSEWKIFSAMEYPT